MIKKLFITLFFICFALEAHAATKTIHTIVALCDNFHQRIYPVPYKLGKGGDPDNNLYWGAMYGIKTYFKNSKDWTLIEEIKNPEDNILRRAVFKHKNSDTYMIADAYLGKEIKSSIEDFLDFSAGNNIKTIEIKNKSIKFGGGADFVAYIGHNGLMDFDLDNIPKPVKNNKKDIAILACYSKSYFRDAIKETKATPVLWTNGKMAPEAYVLKAALDSWIKKESKTNIINSAAAAYAKYQKISNKAAVNLFKDN